MTLILRRRLKDFDSWKKIATEKVSLRAEHGSRGATVYRSAANPNDVIVVFDWDETKPYQAYFNRPDVSQFLQETETVPTEFIEISETFSVSA